MATKRTPEIVREQGPLLGLIGVLGLSFVAQIIYGPLSYSDLMARPSDMVAAWRDLTAGRLDLPAFVPLVSHAFLHGDVGHLFGNLLFLWIFAALAAELIGHRWMLATFFLTAIGGCLWHVVMNAGSAIPMLGASGAVMGFEGLYLAMAIRWHLPDPHIWPMARPIPPGRLAILGVIGLAMDFSGFRSGVEGIAYSAHLGGFVSGLILGALAVPMPRRATPR